MGIKNGKTGGTSGTNGYVVKGTSKGKRPAGAGGSKSQAKASAVADSGSDTGEPELVVGRGVQISNGTTWRVLTVSDGGGFYGKQVLPKPPFPIEGHILADSVPADPDLHLTAAELHLKAMDAGAFGDKPGETNAYLESFQATIAETIDDGADPGSWSENNVSVDDGGDEWDANSERCDDYPEAWSDEDVEMINNAECNNYDDYLKAGVGSAHDVVTLSEFSVSPEQAAPFYSGDDDFYVDDIVDAVQEGVSAEELRRNAA